MSGLFVENNGHQCEILSVYGRGIRDGYSKNCPN